MVDVISQQQKFNALLACKIVNSASIPALVIYAIMVIHSSEEPASSQEITLSSYLDYSQLPVHKDVFLV